MDETFLSFTELLNSNPDEARHVPRKDSFAGIEPTTVAPTPRQGGSSGSLGQGKSSRSLWSPVSTVLTALPGSSSKFMALQKLVLEGPLANFGLGLMLLPTAEVKSSMRVLVTISVDSWIFVTAMDHPCWMTQITPYPSLKVTSFA